MSTDPGLIDLQSHTATLERPRTLPGMDRDEGIVDLTAQARAQQRPTEPQGRQNLSFAAAGGMLAALVGALTWAAVAVVMNHPVTWMALGMGLLIGVVVRTLGRGHATSFGHLGAGLSLFAFILGNCLANSAFVARDAGLSLTSLLAQIGPAALPRLIAATFHPVDILFYGLALYLGYRLSFRRLRRAL